MAGLDFHRFASHPDHSDQEEQAKKPRQQDPKKENQGGGFLQGVFGGLFGGSGKTSPKQSKKAAQEQQPVVKTQPTQSNRPAHQQSFGLSNQKPAEMEEHRANQQSDHVDHDWDYIQKSEVDPEENNRGKQASKTSHPQAAESDPVKSPQSTNAPLVHAHQDETDYFKKKHREGVAQDGVPRSPQSRKRGEELTEREQQLMEAIEDRTNQKRQLASEKYQLEEELDKTKHDIFALRHQVNTLEAEKRAKESSGDHSESERKEVDHLKQRVSELEHHLNILHEHSKKQSRTVFKLKEEAFGVEMQEEQIQSYEGLIQDLEERQDHLQKELSKARSELEMVTKYKESIENELKPLKEEAFRAAAENEELRAKVVQFSESLEAKNQLQRDVYKLENENAELKDQLEAAQAQVVIFENDFADERRDREVAHSKLADLERELAQQKGLYTEEKAEYSRQLAIAQQEAETMRKDLDQANKELENHQATLASVEALNQKLQKKKAQEETDSYWREEARRLKTQLQEAEQHVSELMSTQEDYPAKEAQVEELRKKLEEKTKELDKMTKRVNKLEEDAKSKKKKKKGSDAAAPNPTPQESADARKLARIEQLYNDTSFELQEKNKELVKWQSRFTQLENQNRELELQVKALKANLKEQDKQLQQSGATTPGDPSQVSHQLQIQPHDHGQMQDIQTDSTTNDGRAVSNQPIRAAAPPCRTNAIPEFDDVTSDSVSSRNHPQRPLRASHGDGLSKSNPSGPSTMSQEECYSGNPSHVPASTIPNNQYPQGQVGGSVADQMQSQQFPQPHDVGINPGVMPQAPVCDPQRNDCVNYNPPNVQQQPFQYQQQGYAGGPDQQTVLDAHFSSSQEVLLHRMQERQRQEEQYRQLQLQQQRQMQAQEQQRLMQEQQLLQAQQLQQQQMQAQGYQQHVHDFEPAYQNTYQNIPLNQQYDQGGHSRPSNVPYHQPTPSSVPVQFTTGDGTPGTPEGQNFVVPQESSNSEPATGSLVGIKPTVPGLHSRSDEQHGAKSNLQPGGAQIKQKSNPLPTSSFCNEAQVTEKPILTPHDEASPPAAGVAHPQIDPNESLGDGGRFGNILQDSIDKDIEQFAGEVRYEVSSGRERNVTNTDSPYDPNLVCPMCNKPFRIGEIQKFRAHVNQCEGKKKEGAN